MKLWIIEPRDPLIVRDGRPFGPNPGARATTLPFPLPSTLVGALRHKAGLVDRDSGQFDPRKKDEVLEYAMRGPLLVALGDGDTIANWLLPAPADALLLDPEQPRTPQADATATVLRRWLAPREHDAVTNLPEGLAPVGPAEHRPEKVSAATPRFWPRDALYSWLAAPADDQPALDTLGIRGLEIHSRMHVSITPEQQTAREGALFQTSGLEFTWRDWEQARQHHFITRRLALAAWFDGPTPHFERGFAPMGGERRLMRWRRLDAAQEPFIDADRDSMFEQITRERRCRVVLLTPAYFSDGYRPPLAWTRGGVTAQLVAAVVPRMQTVSGWDMTFEKKNHEGKITLGAPKRTRRLAPAGSVYFVEFPRGVDVGKWLNETWMHNVSDDVQACYDGFGLAVLGVWLR